MLGVCCHWLEEKVHVKSGKIELINVMDERVLQLGRFKSGKYTSEQVRTSYLNNVTNLLNMLPKILKSGVKLFRISSALFPLSDQVDRSLWDNNDIKSVLRKAGDFIKSNDMRVTTHPGQFCVLSSDSDKVVANAFKELSIHGWLFDEMGLEQSPKYAINIHGGKSDRSSRLIEQIKSLPNSVKKRLTLENDESAYSVIDLLTIHKETEVPIVWDSHHHTFNDGYITPEEAFEVTTETWPKDIKPLQHLSNTEPSLIHGSFSERRKHSDMIHYVPDVQLSALRENRVDVEVEAKLKNIAVFEMIKRFDITSLLRVFIYIKDMIKKNLKGAKVPIVGTEFQLHKTQLGVFSGFYKKVIDFTEHRLIKSINSTNDKDSKNELTVLLEKYKKGLVAISWRGGFPHWLNVTKDL